MCVPRSHTHLRGGHFIFLGSWLWAYPGRSRYSPRVGAERTKSVPLLLQPLLLPCLFSPDMQGSSAGLTHAAPLKRAAVCGDGQPTYLTLPPPAPSPLPQVGGLRSNLWPGAYVSGKDKQTASMYVGWGVKNAPFVPLPPPDIAQVRCRLRGVAASRVPRNACVPFRS